MTYAQKLAVITMATVFTTKQRDKLGVCVMEITGVDHVKVSTKSVSNSFEGPGGSMSKIV